MSDPASSRMVGALAPVTGKDMAGKWRSVLVAIVLAAIYCALALTSIAKTTRISGDEMYFAFSGARVFEPAADNLLRSSIEQFGDEIQHLMAAGPTPPDELLSTHRYLGLESQQSSDEYRIPSLVTGSVYSIARQAGCADGLLIGTTLLLSPIAFSVLALAGMLGAMSFLRAFEARLWVVAVLGSAMVLTWLYETQVSQAITGGLGLIAHAGARWYLFGLAKLGDDYFVFAHYPRSPAYALMAAATACCLSGHQRPAMLLVAGVTLFHATHGALFFGMYAAWHVASECRRGRRLRADSVRCLAILTLIAGLGLLGSVSTYIATGIAINISPFIFLSAVLPLLAFLVFASRGLDVASPGASASSATRRRVIALVAVLVATSCLSVCASVVSEGRATQLLALRVGSIVNVMVMTFLAFALVAVVMRWFGRMAVMALAFMLAAFAVTVGPGLGQALRGRLHELALGADAYLARVDQELDFSSDNQRHRVYFAIFAAMWKHKEVELRF